MSSEINLQLSSLQRATVTRFVRKIMAMLEEPQVVSQLETLNKGLVIFEVANGTPVEVTIVAKFRRGKELPATPREEI